MPADWSSILTGFGIVWTVVLVYAASIFWRISRTRTGEDPAHVKR